MEKKKIVWIILITVLITIIHISIPERYPALHIFFRLLYFILIVYTALATGKKGGMIASVAVSLIVLPHFFFSSASTEFITGNVAAIVLFNLVGFYAGMFRDRTEVSLTKRKQTVCGTLQRQRATAGTTLYR